MDPLVLRIHKGEVTRERMALIIRIQGENDYEFIVGFLWPHQTNVDVGKTVLDWRGGAYFCKNLVNATHYFERMVEKWSSKESNSSEQSTTCSK